MRTVVGLVVAALIFAAIGVSLFLGVGPLPDPARCEATVGGRTVDLDVEQAENVALIAAKISAATTSPTTVRIG